MALASLEGSVQESLGKMDTAYTPDTAYVQACLHHRDEDFVAERCDQPVPISGEEDRSTGIYRSERLWRCAIAMS